MDLMKRRIEIPNRELNSNIQRALNDAILKKWLFVCGDQSTIYI